ncbi:DNA repair protein RecN [Myxococcota bacterium]|nr:DNA repair protein RecN [Myxococcota bacterium]MBU1431399.1 DNA repair protein RecN [Myxococcota bacterium]MBU1898517.1 DNA repair protein RecN [Myxococcota bacterium]
MLRSLSIKDFAIIDRVELAFQEGLTVITGETGAGKSIIINALMLMLGERARADVVRTGAERAEVQAIFDLKHQPDSRETLSTLGLEGGRYLTLRRVISRNTRHRIYINGQLSTLQTLERVTRGLVDISGQHEHYSLLRADAHLDLLDRVAGLWPLRAEVEHAYRVVADLDIELSTLRKQQRARAEREDYLRFQLGELEAAHLKSPDEEAELERESARLSNVEKLRHATDAITWALYRADDAAIEQINRSIGPLRTLAKIEQRFAALLTDLESALAVVDEVAHTMNGYGQRLSADPRRLEEVEGRLALFARLRRKYGATLAEIIERKHSLEEALEALEGIDAQIEEVEQERLEAAKQLLTRARQLSEARQAGAAQLVRAVSQELHELGMTGASLVVSVEPLTTGVRVGEAWLSTRGLDRVIFLLSANPGEAPQSLSRVASGGELSRFMLAVKRVIAANDPVGSYIFDEVDTGVGGPTAEAIGRKLKAVSSSRQALCITHLPQIAALGDHHLHVFKAVHDERTTTSVRLLTGQARVEELARMLSGARITNTTRANAAELLQLGHHDDERPPHASTPQSPAT